MKIRSSRAGATYQTPLFRVEESAEYDTCGNSTLYLDKQEETTTFASGSARSVISNGRIALVTAGIGAVLVPAFISVLL